MTTQRKRLEIANNNLCKKLIIIAIASQRSLSAHALDTICRVQFPDHRAVIVGQNETALDALQNAL